MYHIIYILVNCFLVYCVFFALSCDSGFDSCDSAMIFSGYAILFVLLLQENE